MSRPSGASTKGLKLMEAPIAGLMQLADTLPADTRDKELDKVKKLQAEALAPIGHAMRFLAMGYNELSFKRHDAIVAAIKDPILQQRIKNASLGIDSFFLEDLSRDIDSALSRQQQNALTAAIRHKPASSSSSRAREPKRRQISRSPVRRDRDNRRRPAMGEVVAAGQDATEVPCLGDHIRAWRRVTHKQYVLNSVEGYRIDFVTVPPLLGPDRALTGSA